MEALMGLIDEHLVLIPPHTLARDIQKFLDGLPGDVFRKQSRGRAKQWPWNGEEVDLDLLEVRLVELGT